MVLIGFALGASVGLGTLLCIVFIGPIFEATMKTIAARKEKRLALRISRKKLSVRTAFYYYLREEKNPDFLKILWVKSVFSMVTVLLDLVY